MALGSTDIEGIKDHHRKAAAFYLQSANTYPEDDEQHACMFHYLLVNFILQSTATYYMLDRVPQLRS